jgi:hypothetical protein
VDYYHNTYAPPKDVKPVRYGSLDQWIDQEHLKPFLMVHVSEGRPYATSHAPPHPPRIKTWASGHWMLDSRPIPESPTVHELPPGKYTVECRDPQGRNAWLVMGIPERREPAAPPAKTKRKRSRSKARSKRPSKKPTPPEAPEAPAAAPAAPTAAPVVTTDRKPAWYQTVWDIDHNLMEFGRFLRGLGLGPPLNPAPFRGRWKWEQRLSPSEYIVVYAPYNPFTKTWAPAPPPDPTMRPILKNVFGVSVKGVQEEKVLRWVNYRECIPLEKA